MEVALTSLWLPILLSAIAVFIASSVIWMALQYHNSDWKALPDEEAARAALKGTLPGQYTLPYAADNKARQSSDWLRKYQEGPAAMLVVLPHGELAMGKQLAAWFVYCVVISLLVAYVAGITLPAGSEYLRVFRVTCTVAWLAYAGAAAMGSIWFGHAWGRTVKDIIDGLIYALLSAGIFGWLWP